MRSLIISRKAQFDILSTMAWLESHYRSAVAASWYDSILRAADALRPNPEQHPTPDGIVVSGLDLRE